MAFGDKIKRTCATCGNEFEGFPQSKYCSDTCKPKRDRNKKKEPKEVIKDDGNANNSGNGNSNNMPDNNNSKDNISIVGDGGGIPGGNDNKDSGRNDKEHNTTESVPNSIQIIDSNTGKKEKGIVDQVLEKLFSDDLAPITTSILASLATRLQQPNNATEDGLLTAEDGSKHAMI